MHSLVVMYEVQASWTQRLGEECIGEDRK